MHHVFAPDIQVVRRHQLKYVRVSIRDVKTVRVTVPHSYRASDINDLLMQKKQWILKGLHKMRLRDHRRMQDGVLFLGKPLTIAHDPLQRSRCHFDPLAHTLTCREPPDTSSTKHLVNDWMKVKARRFLPHRLSQLSAETGIDYRRLIIRGQRTRFGTCSAHGNISLNWKLMRCPLAVIDYVIYHELAHRREMNHSSAFWSIVAGLCPHYKETRQWLKNHSEVLDD